MSPPSPLSPHIITRYSSVWQRNDGSFVQTDNHFTITLLTTTRHCDRTPNTGLSKRLSGIPSHQQSAVRYTSLSDLPSPKSLHGIQQVKRKAIPVTDHG
jgi:hypothetical protein